MSTCYSVPGHHFHHYILFELVSPNLVPVPLSVYHLAVLIFSIKTVYGSFVF